MTAESLGWQLRSALPPMRLHSVSICDTEGDVLWLSEGALGPDEHNVVIEALESMKADTSQPYTEYGMEDGRIAVFLPIRGTRNDLIGTVMILADMKSLSDATLKNLLTPQIRATLVKIAMFMRKNAPASTSDSGPQVVMPGAAAAVPTQVNVTSTTVIEKLPTPIPDPLGPKEVEQILELELVAEPPKPAAATPAVEPPPAAPAGAPPKGGARAAPGKAAGAKSPPSLRRNSPMAAPYPGTARDAAPAAAQPATVNRFASAPATNPKASPNLVAVPARDVEVLAFEPDVEIPTVKPAAAEPPVEVEVLSFDVEAVEVTPVAKASPTHEMPVLAEAEVEVTPPPPGKPAAPDKAAKTGSFATVTPAPTPAAASASLAGALPGPAAIAASAPAPKVGATGSFRATPAAPVAAPAPAPPAARANAPAAAPAVQPAPVAPPTLTPASSATGTTPALKARSATTGSHPVKNLSTTQTTAVPVISDDDDIPDLIQDTASHPKLEVAEAAAPEEPLPPLEPLSVEESATDLVLFAQELIKLRSNGRTRRYEVLARSKRDLHRNEVPAAFVAETARGKDGAALDSMVVERLLAWLGQHGEAIWDSEPASFSVNLSIGAIEDETFPQRIEQWLQQHNVPAEYVGFEVTEFACIQCKPAVQRFVQAVEQMGCFLVIDNFSLDSGVFEFLGSKALRHVKLDPKLTTAAMKEKLPQALVVAILQACKVLGVHCVAKRIESQSSMQWLTAVGCDFAQSFQLHKPLPLDSLASGQPIKALRE